MLFRPARSIPAAAVGRNSPKKLTGEIGKHALPQTSLLRGSSDATFKRRVVNSELLELINRYRRFLSDVGGYEQRLSDEWYEFSPSKLVIKDCELSDTTTLGDLPDIILEFARCRFEQPFNMVNGVIKGIRFVSCQFEDGIKAQCLSVSSGFEIVEECRIKGMLDLDTATIKGDLFISNSIFLDPQAQLPDDRKSGCCCFCGGVSVHSIILDGSTFRGRFFAGSAIVEGIVSAAACQFFVSAVPEIVAGQMGDEQVQLEDFELTWASHIALDCPGIRVNGSFSASERYHYDGPEKSAKRTIVIGQINLSGARILGDLDLSGVFARTVFSILPEQSLSLEFEKPEAKESLFACVYGSRCSISGALFLEGGADIRGQVRFNSCSIHGVVSFNRSSFFSLIASIENSSWLKKIYEDVFQDSSAWNFEDYSTSLNEVLGRGLENAYRDRLLCRTLTRAISFDRSNLLAGFYMHRGCCLGGLSFRNVSIQKNFDIKCGVVVGLGHREGAFGLSGASIGGHIHIIGDTQRVETKDLPKKIADTPPHLDKYAVRILGRVRMQGARIGGNLHFTRARFFVDHLLYRYEGEKRTDSTFREVYGNDTERKARRKVIELRNTTVDGITFFAEGDAEDTSLSFGDVDLSGLSTIEIYDSEPSWPSRGGSSHYWPPHKSIKGEPHLLLDGLVYDQLSAPLSGPARVNWLLKQPEHDRKKTLDHQDTSGFRTQPWRQAAKVLRDTGYTRDADYVASKEQMYLRWHAGLPLHQKLFNMILAFAVGHGYMPWFAAVWAALFVLTGAIIFDQAWQKGQILPSQEEVQLEVGKEGLSAFFDEQPLYPKFNAFLYSVDVIVPFLDFRQEEYWLASAAIETGSVVGGRWYERDSVSNDTAGIDPAEETTETINNSQVGVALSQGTDAVQNIGFIDLVENVSSLLYFIKHEVDRNLKVSVPGFVFVAALTAALLYTLSLIFDLMSLIGQRRKLDAPWIVLAPLGLLASAAIASVLVTLGWAIAVILAPILIFHIKQRKRIYPNEEYFHAYNYLRYGVRGSHYSKKMWALGTAIVIAAVYFWITYFFSPKDLSFLLDMTDSASLLLLNAPFAQVWMVLQIVIGWVLLSAIIAGLSKFVRS